MTRIRRIAAAVAVAALVAAATPRSASALPLGRSDSGSFVTFASGVFDHFAGWIENMVLAAGSWADGGQIVPNPPHG